jgi:hypothetical protein
MNPKAKRNLTSSGVFLLAAIIFYFVFKHWDSLKGALFS